MYKLTKRKIIYIFVIVLAVLQLFFNRNQPPKISLIPTVTPTPTVTITLSEKQLVKVIRVVDGDTIEIENGQKIRYIGINAPEFFHDTNGRKTGEECYAKESYEENKKLVEGKKITLVKDVSDKDKYGRLLRYVYVDDLFINDYLIKNGFAKNMAIKPDLLYYQQFKIEEKKARENKHGLWNNCPL